MNIVLVRHGRPTGAENQKVNSAGFGRWVKRYNHSLVDESSKPDLSVFHHYQHYYAVASDLPRAVHSCEIALSRSPSLQSSQFREMDIPRYKLPFKLNAWTWVYLCRALWTVGVPGKFESYREAKIRAKRAANQLIALAETEQNVIVFAHGYINLHMRKQLRQRGFTQTEKSSQYWGITAFNKP